MEKIPIIAPPRLPDHPHLLLVKLSSFGDVLHALPTLEALRAAHPGAQITWLVEAAYAPLLAGHPALDEVWLAPRLHPGELLTGDNPTRLRTLLRQLRAQPFDLVVDVQGLLKSAVWVALAKSSRKVGYDRTRELSYLALTERVPPFDPEAHAVRRYLNLAHYLGAPPAPLRFRLGLDAAADTRALLPATDDRPLAVLHPGARWATKLWPAASWATLATHLHGRGLRVAITGSAADQELATDIIEQSQTPIINLAGRTSLAELAAVLRRARLAVTTDTGAMHLAAALGTPLVALFGPTAPWRTGPFGQGHQVVRLDLACSPCFKRRCPAPRCLSDLTPDLVAAACEKILSKAGIS
ncbi:MAG: lipopolysaccharide heptosyltransferase I [Syntrophobacterales bacterium]|nr:lipopolysaccharide heptosyltransferase I [Syntrophobacterales bacterium]